MKRFNVAEWAIKHKSIIYFFIIVIVLGGIWSYFNLGRSEDPDFTMKQSVVAVAWPGASSEQMAEKVADPLERKLQETKGIDNVKSVTHDGKTIIYVTLSDSVPQKDIATRWHDVRNLVNDEMKNLPSGVIGPFVNDRFDDVYGSIYAVTGDDYSYEEKRKAAEELRRKLSTVKDVQQVKLLGVQEQTIYIEMDQNKLASMGISPASVFQMLKRQSSLMPSGMIQTGSRDVAIRVSGLLENEDSIRQIPIQIGDRSFKVGDIASVHQVYAQPEKSLMYFNGKPAIGVAVSMVPGGDNTVLGKNLQKVVEQEKSNLPLGMDIGLVADQPSVVVNSIGEFTESLIEAIVIVMIASFISLGLWSGIVLALCIPVVVCASFIFMKWQGIDLHIVSLGSLIVSLGLLVDDAIIVIEMMQVKLEKGLGRMEAAQAAYKSCAKPMLAGTLITAAGFIPVGFSKGPTAEYVGAFFFVIAATLILSWLTSIFVSPVLGYKFIRINTEKKENAFSRVSKKVADKTYEIFHKWITYCIRFKRTVMIATVGIFALTILAIPFVNKEFFPDSVRPELILDVNLPQGSSITDTKKVMSEIANTLYGDKRVSSFSTYIGDTAPRFIFLFDPKPAESGHGQMIIVTTGGKGRDTLKEEVLKNIAEKYPDVQAHIRLMQTGPPSEYPVMLRLSADNVKDTIALANRAMELMKTNKHVVNPSMDWPQEAPTVKLNIDQNKVRKLGIDNYAVAQDLYVKLSGVKVGESYQGNQNVPISFKLEGSNTQRLAQLESMPVHVGNNKFVPLGQIAEISYENEISSIYRRNLKPTITLRCEVQGSTADSVAEELYDDTLKDFRENLPEGASLEKGGRLEMSEKSLKNLVEPVPIMIILILTVLIFELEKLPLMAIAAITGPLGLIGAIWTLLITRQPIGFVSIIGMIALAGMIIRNSIILLDQIRQHLSEGMSAYDAVVKFAALRFRPIMLSSVTDVLGFVPLIPNPFWRPLAVSFIGGLMVATVIGLLVVPAMYCWYYKVNEPER